MLVVQLLLCALLVVAGLSLLVPSPAVAAVLAALSAAWLPVNNRHLEGPTLIVVSNSHGLTVADLFAYVGLVLALVAAWRWRRHRIRTGGAASWTVGTPATAAFVLFVVVMLGCGLTASWFDHSATALQVRRLVHHVGD